MASITFTSTGAISAVAFNATSTREKKENIKPAIVNAVDFLKDVDVVNFTFIDDPNHNLHIGFIAEDTDELLSTPGHNQMEVGNCIGMLIKAVQELSEKNEKLESKIKELENKSGVVSAL